MNINEIHGALRAVLRDGGITPQTILCEIARLSPAASVVKQILLPHHSEHQSHEPYLCDNVAINFFS